MNSPAQSTTELARQLGLSRWTVSRALNHQGGVNAETAERVREEARRQGFSPSILGRGLRSGRTDLIGVVAPDIEDYYLTRKINELRHSIEAAGLHGMFQIIDSANEERSALERLSAIRCTGVVIIASRLPAEDSALLGLAAGRTPIVFADPLYEQKQGTVRTDRALALKISADHLYALGHRHIGILGIEGGSSYGEQRLNGLRSVCAAHKLRWEDTFTFFYKQKDMNDFEGGGAMFREMTTSGAMPSALIALNDRIALGAMNAAIDSGLRVPEDLSIIGYDDADFSAHTSPSLTTVIPNASLLMKKVVEVLLGEESASSSWMIEPELAVRNSTGPFRAGKKTVSLI